MERRWRDAASGEPENPELGVGAVAEDGTGVFDPRSAAMLGMTQAAFNTTLALESRELRRRVERYRDGRPPISVDGRTVIVIDDFVTVLVRYGRARHWPRGRTRVDERGNGQGCRRDLAAVARCQYRSRAAIGPCSASPSG